jgi:hypothetical protein
VAGSDVSLTPDADLFRRSAGKIDGSFHATSELLPQESDNFPRFVAVFAFPHRQFVPELCLQVLQAIIRI